MRNPKDKNYLQSLIKIIASCFSGIRKHYEKIGLQYVEVPEIVGITGACENVDTLFKVSNRLDLPLFITQTGQLALEQALQFFPGVYTIIHSGRDEEIEDARHLRQFRLTEEEFDWTLVNRKKPYDEEKMYLSLLNHIELATKAMMAEVFENDKDILKKVYQQNPLKIKEILSYPYLKIDYEEALTILNKNGFILSWEDDLKAEHEEMVVKLVNKQQRKKIKHHHSLLLPVFIMRYPKEIKFFNMKVSNNDSRVVLSADLIMPLAGEAVGSAVREHRAHYLKQRLLESTMFKIHKHRGGDYNDFIWYIDDIIGKKLTNPHAGYGIGNERIIQFILGQKDIRTCSLFSLMAEQTKDWDKKRRGMLHLLGRKKTILFSIGKIVNKKRLLPVIKKISNGNFTFYATEKTYHFLKFHGIESALVYKISQKKEPNLKDLLKQNLLDIIINIPTRRVKKGKEYTDGQIIRKTALKTGIMLITDVEVAEDFIENLINEN